MVVCIAHICYVEHLVNPAKIGLHLLLKKLILQENLGSYYKYHSCYCKYMYAKRDLILQKRGVITRFQKALVEESRHYINAFPKCYFILICEPTSNFEPFLIALTIEHLHYSEKNLR